MAQSLQPCLLTIIEWWKAVVVARGVLTAIEAGAAGFRLGLQVCLFLVTFLVTLRFSLYLYKVSTISLPYLSLSQIMK